MPGKVNPVMPEMVNQVAIRVMANDLAVTTTAAMGQLELNAFVPIIAHHLLDSLEVMTNGVSIFTGQCIKGIKANRQRCEKLLSYSAGLITDLTPYLGYEQAQQVFQKARKEEKRVGQVVMEMKLMEEEQLRQIFNPREMTRPGIAGDKSLAVSTKTTRQE